MRTARRDLGTRRATTVPTSGSVRPAPQFAVPAFVSWNQRSRSAGGTMPQRVQRRTAIKTIGSALAAPLIIGRRASAAERSIYVGIYSGQQSDVMRKQIIPPFEARQNCKV